MKLRVGLLGLCIVILPSIAHAADKSPRELYDAIKALRMDPASVYQIDGSTRIELRRSDVQISFDRGKLVFYAPLDGRITGAVFSGRGHALAMPRDAVEKQQMARFLGAPVLDQDFTYVFLRFTDDTAEDLLRQLHNAQLTPQQDPVFASQWDAYLAGQHPGQYLRVLAASLSQNTRPYFYAAIDGVATGAFDVLLDPEHEEPLMIGQPKKFGPESKTYFDIWASYKIPGISPPPAAFRSLRYSIDTTILSNNSLEAKTDVRLRAESSGERLLIFQLSRMLSVDAVTGDRGEPLAFFQNEGIDRQQQNTRADNHLYVVLPAAPQRGAEFGIQFRYRGNVIENAGNGVFFVGARENWYPHFGDPAHFSSYDLTMRWPRRLRLVATGVKTEEHEEGDFRVGHWRTEKPAPVAGFNLGDYASASISAGSYSVEIFANRQLEQALRDRLSPPGTKIDIEMPGPLSRRSPSFHTQMQSISPSPADALKSLAREIDSSVRFYEALSGPFPFRTLNVSQIPGTFGQGWPGLIYLSTFSFLPSEAQKRAGLSAAQEAHFADLVPFHEVAHQWWGNVVGWSSYRDQWIAEAIASYFALLFADHHRGSDHALRLWLDRYRKNLTERAPGAEPPPSEIGPLALGNRLTSSKSPTGFEDLVYPKGAWVMHMVREMLRQSGNKNPDARFIALLRTLVTKYSYRALSTADLQRELEAVMTPAMDLEGGHSMEWFFEQWVRGTGIPRYRVEFSVARTEKGFTVKGKLFQDGVPDSFIAPVPIYASLRGRPVRLGVVLAEGSQTSFRFTAEAAPRKLLIDPQMTLLCLTQ
jgi:hypothetical protein